MVPMVAVEVDRLLPVVQFVQWTVPKVMQWIVGLLMPLVIWAFCPLIQVIHVHQVLTLDIAQLMCSIVCAEIGHRFVRLHSCNVYYLNVIVALLSLFPFGFFTSKLWPVYIQLSVSLIEHALLHLSMCNMIAYTYIYIYKPCIWLTKIWPFLSYSLSPMSTPVHS